MAYSPRTDLLTPSVAPETQGYGPGLSAGVSNFANLVSQGLTAKRQDARDEKIWEQTLIRDKANYDHDYTMLNRREQQREQKELTGKQEEADFASGAWETIRQQMPEIITPEMNDKFVSGSLGTKRGLLVQGQAAFTRALAERQNEQERAAKQQAATSYGPIAGTNYVGNALGSALPLATTKPQAGFQDLGNGTGAVYGPDGKPMNPAYLLKQGPAGMEPALPRQTPAPRTPAPVMIDGKPHRMNQQTGAYEPVPIQSGTGNPNAALFQ